jgi:tetratricopeptide (TPR) repeat protein
MAGAEEPTLRLLGTCEFVVPDGENISITGPRAPLVIAIAALSGPKLSSDDLADLLGTGGRSTPTEGALNTLRARLDPEIKSRLGRGAKRWVLSEVTVDVKELRAEALELQTLGVDANPERLKKVLKLAAEPLLADLTPDAEVDWLQRQRESLEELRVAVLAVAIAAAEHRGDPSSRDLIALWKELRPDEDPPKPRPPQTAPVAERNPVSNIGMADATTLVGRKDELRRLQNRFEKGIRSQVICGEGGIGKSDLALTFVQLHASEYGICWKVTAESEVELRTGLRRLGRRIGVAVPYGDSEEDVDWERFMEELGDRLGSGEHGRWLLLLDDVVRPEALEGVWPHLPANGHLLVTSQFPDWAASGLEELQLLGLELDDAIELLAGVSGRPGGGDEALAAICKELDCHPMLLTHAALTMFTDGVRPSVYLKQLRGGIEQAVQMWPELGVTGHHAVTTYRLAIERAALETPGARILIETVAFLAPEPIEESLLHDGIGAVVPELADPGDLVRARRALRNRSLIQTNQRTEAFSAHGVVQVVARLGIEEADVPVRMNAAIGALRRALPPPDSEDANERRRPLVPHAEAVLGHVGASEDTALHVRAAELASHLGMFYRSQSEWAAAEAAHERAVELSREEPDRRAAAMRGIRLANVIRQRGRFDDAEVVLAVALPALRDVAEPTDVHLAYALTVQARILRVKPESAPHEARRLFDEALAILDHHGADSLDHREQLSRTLNYSAVVLRQLGEYTEAEAQSRRGFEILTGQQPETWLRNGTAEVPAKRLLAVHLRSLGNLWRLLGRFAKAREAHERALEIVSLLFDESHTDVGRCLDSLGRVQRERGEFDDALVSFERALRISDLRFGPDYPHAATAKTNIAIVLREIERRDEALIAIEEAIKVYRRTYGDSWSDGTGELINEHTAWAVFVRGEIRASLGDEVGAKRDHREVLRLRRKLYGRAHPHIASSLQGLADVALIEGNRSLAVDLNRQAWEIRDRAFGQDGSYWIAQSDLRLGALLEDPEERLVHLRDAERAWSAQLVPDHPWLVGVRKAIDEIG